jgi:hypothetical protein
MMKRPATAAGAGQHRKLKKAASYPSLSKAADEKAAAAEVRRCCVVCVDV